MGGPTIEHYLGSSGLGEALGVTRHAVHKWRARYPAGSTHPFPEPDVAIDGTPGWAACRVAEVERWRAGLPGRGAGGGRPPASRQRYLEVATAHGLDHDEASRLVTELIAEFPEMTEGQIHDWMIDRWQT